MAKTRSKLGTNFEYFAVRGIVGAIGLLPLKWSLRVGEKIGDVAYLLAAKLRRVGRRNLELALPELLERERAEILRGCFQNLGRQLGLFSHFARLTPKDLRKLIDIKGLEHLIAAHNSQRGVIFATAHFGGWELSAFVTAAIGYPLNILVRRIDNPRVEKYVDKLRTRFGSQTIDKSESARTMFRLLKSGKPLGILADLNTQPHEGVFVDFFGIAASTSAGLAKLAVRTDAIVLPAFAHWSASEQKYCLQFEPPLEMTKTGDFDRDVLHLTAAVTARIENLVRLYPEQWLWIHKRWNTRPAGEPDLYGANQKKRVTTRRELELRSHN